MPAAHPPCQLRSPDAHPLCSAPRGNSIYVTASRNLSEDGGASREGSRPTSPAPAGSPRSRSPSPGSPLSRASSSLSRRLNVPWALPRLGSGRRADLSAAAGAQHAQQSQHDQHAASQLAALLEASGLEGAEQGAAAEYLGMSEEEALQRALEMSLLDSRQPAEQQPAGACAGAAPDGRSAATEQQQQQQQAPGQAAPAAAEQAAVHVRYNAAFATSRGEGQRNPLYGGTSGADMPATE